MEEKKVGALPARFYKNLLEEEGVTKEELETYWRYAGGDRGSHENYFQLVYAGRIAAPDHRTECFCETPIKENCYIARGDRLLPVGNCCIKRFLPEGVRGRTCEQCGAPHRNRVVNRCNRCRRCRCDRCGRSISFKYKVCYDCKFGTEHE